MVPGNIYIIATPIGNLGDITWRALETLKKVDVILCEDTRVTKKLLDHYGIQKTLISYHQHSWIEKILKNIEEILLNGENIALVTDAGTPGISDPGNELIAELIKKSKKGIIKSIRIVPIPGPSAVTAALSISGFPTAKFLFLGFPPHKGRQKFFQEVATSPHTVAFYESPYRIKKCLAELRVVLEPTRQICVCRELTKKFESVYRGNISEIIEMQIPAKGEFVVVINTK